MLETWSQMCPRIQFRARVAGFHRLQERGWLAGQNLLCLNPEHVPKVSVVLLGSPSPAFTVVSWLPEKVRSLVFPPSCLLEEKNTLSRGLSICSVLLTSQ